MDASRYEDFQIGMALCTDTVLKTIEPGHVFYINFLMNITALCDCWGFTTPSLVPDIGIMASQDIVAIERASLDAIKVENLIRAGLPEGLELGEEGHLLNGFTAKPLCPAGTVRKTGIRNASLYIRRSILE